MSISITVKPKHPTSLEGWPAGTRSYRVTLHKGRKRFSVDYHQGPGIREEPTAERVLESLALDASVGSQSFEDYCSEFGADPYDKKARKIYKACARTTPKLRNFLGEEDYETLLANPDANVHAIVHTKTRSTR